MQRIYRENHVFLCIFSHARGRGFEPRQPHQWKTVTKVTVFSFFEDGEPRPAFIRDAGFCAGGA